MRIMFTKLIVETEFGGKVIYGDTDSVFVSWPSLDSRAKSEIWSTDLHREEIMRASSAACKRITDLMPRPMELAFEKAFDHLLMIQKKQYSGWL
jgi:DNA polymerase elongation subunit (family B)